MRKVLVVAKNEYLIAVTSKAFLVGIIIMPFLMGGAIIVRFLTKDQVDITDRKIAVVTESERLRDAVLQRAKQRNEQQIFNEEDDSEKTKQIKPKFLVEPFTLAEIGEKDFEVELSKRIKDGELFAFAVIGKNPQAPQIRYYSQTPSYSELPNWLGTVVNDELRRMRAEQLGISDAQVAALSQRQRVQQFGLVERGEDGEIVAREENRLLVFVVPMAGLMLMFMMVMSVAPAMLNTVLEEKMQKISEFLVSSITPFQLMLGKLAGAVGIGLTLSVVYLGAAFTLANYYEVASRIPISLYVWFVCYLFIALIIFGSIFSAIGAACSEIRDAQSLMTPVMLLVVIPMMCIGPIFSSPSSVFSKAVSLFPPATPMLMFARQAMPPGPAVWEIVLGFVLSVSFAIICVWAAGKVFRIGVLSQGQAPTLGKLIGWIFSK